MTAIEDLPTAAEEDEDQTAEEHEDQTAEEDEDQTHPDDRPESVIKNLEEGVLKLTELIFLEEGVETPRKDYINECRKELKELMRGLLYEKSFI